MGYTTEFYGDFAITPPLKPEHQVYLKAFAGTRRMARDEAKVELLPDPVRLAADLPIGFEGAYYVGGVGDSFGQVRDESILDYNNPPGAPRMPYGDMKNFNAKYTTELQLKARALELGLAQPGLWCQWIPDESGTSLRWDGGEKFYDYVEWLDYLIAHFLAPWGYQLDGEVEWQGEERDDQGLIRVTANHVKILRPQVSWV